MRTLVFAAVWNYGRNSLRLSAGLNVFGASGGTTSTMPHLTATRAMRSLEAF